MSQTCKMVLIVIVAALMGGGGVFLWQNSETQESPPVSTQEEKLNELENTAADNFINKFAGVIKYNCEKSSGSFINNSCICPIEEELGQTQEMMYDKKTGYCQSTHGGPVGEAFFAEIGLPYGEYGFYSEIIQNLCLDSGGELSGAACICPSNTTYDKTTGYCK